MRFRRGGTVLLVAALGACAPLTLDPPAPVAWVVYDPGAGTIPTPNDLVRDAAAGRLALPIDDGMSAAEQALRAALNEQDAWSSVTTPTFTLSARVDPATVTPETVSVWAWTLAPAPVPGLVPVVAEDGLSVEIPLPAGGWAPGGRYVVVVRGLATADGVAIGPSPAFGYLRSPEPLTGHDRAFPGADRAEREATAARLEAIRADLAPTFDTLAAQGVPRDTIAAAWAFTVTRRPELAMDAASQRMPLPFDLLRDPTTGLVDLPPNDADDALEAEAKLVANTLRGFALSAGLSFEATHALDPDTVSDTTVELWDLSGVPARVPAEVRAWREAGPCVSGDDGCVYVVVDPRPEGAGAIPLPLAPATTYAVLVRQGVTDAYGEPLAPMSLGQLLRVDAPLVADGSSTVPNVPDDDALRVEPIRAAVDVLLDSVGRDGVVTAWTFTTLDAAPALHDTLAVPDALAYDATPTVLDRGPPNRLFGDDPLSDLFPGLLNPADVVYLPRVDGVAEVIEGTLPSPVHLDPVTRRWREPPVLDPIRFLATVPDGVPADEPVPVVIFGHGLVTDRRWVLTISGELAKRGFATIAVDLPYHGERTVCVDQTLLAIPNFFPPPLQGILGATEPLLQVPGCPSGDAGSCSPTGQCLDADGQPEPFAAFPIIDVRPASGAAFLDVHDLPHIPDHFRQALVDLSAVRYSLQTADWATALGQPIRTDAFLYAGQSLGGILGADFAALEPSVARAVLNVPGADMVDLFVQSTMFGPQMDTFLAERGIVVGSYEHERLLDVARWLIDSVDPQSVAHLYREDSGVQALIQLDRVNASLGDIVIPNAATDVLIAVSGLPVIEYPSALHADLVIPVIGDEMLRDLADFLAEGTP